MVSVLNSDPGQAAKSGYPLMWTLGAHECVCVCKGFLLPLEVCLGYFCLILGQNTKHPKWSLGLAEGEPPTCREPATAARELCGDCHLAGRGGNVIRHGWIAKLREVREKVRSWNVWNLGESGGRGNNVLDTREILRLQPLRLRTPLLSPLLVDKESNAREVSSENCTSGVITNSLPWNEDFQIFVLFSDI